MKFILLLLILFAIGCTENGLPPGYSTEGYAPVYLAADVVKKISTGSSRAALAPGKIYAYRNFIFQNDINNGIHIIDNSNPSQPRKVGYIDIPLSTEVAVKGDFLYSNNLNDLVVFDISKPAEPRLVKRVEDVFPTPSQRFPPVNGTAFECADPEKGIVIRWEKKPLKNPACRR